MRVFVLVSLLLVTICLTEATAQKQKPEDVDRLQVLQGSYGTHNGEPRDKKDPPRKGFPRQSEQ